MRGLSLAVPLSLGISLSALDLTLSASIILCLLLTDRARRSLKAALASDRAANLRDGTVRDSRFSSFAMQAGPSVRG